MKPKNKVKACLKIASRPTGSIITKGVGILKESPMHILQEIGGTKYTDLPASHTRFPKD